MNVLVVEDDPDVSDLWRLWLSGDDVDVHNDPADVMGNPNVLDDVDVAVLDMMMPDIDGATLARWIRRVRPDLPIVIVSAIDPYRHTTADLPDDVQVLRKPVNDDLFLEVVRGAR